MNCDRTLQIRSTKTGVTLGRELQVTDVETGEAIRNVRWITIRCGWNEIVTATIELYPVDIDLRAVSWVHSTSRLTRCRRWLARLIYREGIL